VLIRQRTRFVRLQQRAAIHVAAGDDVAQNVSWRQRKLVHPKTVCAYRRCPIPRLIINLPWLMSQLAE